jgi:tetratricopeptide (TPR) repeat protein
MRFFGIAIFFAFACASGQDNLTQQKQERDFSTILNLYNAENFRATLPAIHTYFKDFGTTTQQQAELKYFEAISTARLGQKDAEQKLNQFTTDFPAHSRVATACFEMASLSYRNKNYQKTVDQLSALDFEKLSKSQDVEARFMMGYSYFNLKKLNEALDQFNFIKGSENAYSPAASYYAAYIELSNGVYDAALRDLQRIEKQSSYAAVVPYLIAQVYYKQGKDDELINYAATVSTQSGIQNLEDINLLASEAYFRKKNYPKAIEGYNQFLKGKTTADRGILFRAGFANFSSGNSKEAIEQFKKAASDKDSVGAYASYYLGISYLKTTQKPLALTAFQVAQNFEKDSKLVEESGFQSAKLLYDLGRADEAIDDMEAFQTQFPASEHSHEIGELLSSAYVNASSYHKAITHIEALTKRTPATDKAYQKATYLFGTEYYNKNEYPKAVEYFDKSLNFPFDAGYAAKAALWAGESYAVAGEWEKAIPYYEKALAAKPDAETTAKTRFGLGYARYNLQQYDRALFSFKEYVNTAAKSDVDLANGYVRLADCYYVSKQYPEALANYKTAYSFSRSDQDYARLQAGVLSGILRKYPEALAELDVVIKTYSSSAYWDEAVFQRAQIEFEMGNYAGAQTYYSLLISRKPTSRFVPFAYGRRAAANYNLKDYNKTANDYIALLEQYAGHPAARETLLPLQEALNLAGRGGEFDKYLSVAQKNNTDPKGLESVTFEAAKNSYFNQDYQRAITSLSSFISGYTTSPKVVEARYYRAESYYRLKESQKAVDAYREIDSDEKFVWANKVAGRLAELEFKLGHYEQAVEANRKLSKLATTAKEKYNSWIGLMDGFYLLTQYDSSMVYADKLLNDPGVGTPTQNRAALTSGKIAMAKGDYETAKDEFLTIVNTSTDEYGAEAKYRIGEIQYLTKAHKQCYETLVALNKDYGAYPLWVGKAFLLLSDNFVAQGDIFNATAGLKSLAEKFPLETIKEEARIKLKALEQAELSKQKAPQDSIDNK